MAWQALLVILFWRWCNWLSAPSPELAALRRALHFAPSFEFKFTKTTTLHKEAFFRVIQEVPFRVRAVVVDKYGLDARFRAMNGLDFSIEFITRLALRTPALDLASDVLVIDGTTSVFRRALRIRLSQECRLGGRPRPFKQIVSGDSKRDDGLQLADMIVGAVRQYVVGGKGVYYQTFARKVVDLWLVPERGQ